ncbi:hypothetical protein BYT27DRAFT_7209578 [Phlegmacium glaucopus]|nr:hypothetical protein BYT27DRAFT_7209578 [Phlegmacium glaucopus]
MVSPRGDYFGEYDDLEMQEDEMDVDQESLINGDSNDSDQPVDFEDEDPDNEATLEADEAEEEAVPELARPTVSDPHGSGVGADSQDDFNSEDLEAEGEDSELEIEDLTQRKETEEQLQRRPFAVKYGNHAGEPVQPNISKKSSHEKYQESLQNISENIYAPFANRMEWEISQWAKFRGPSSTAFSELMGIEGVVEKLGLSFRNSVELNKIIDMKLPGRPAFQRHSVEVGGEMFDVYFRDILACVKALYSDPEFAPYLLNAPERHFTDEACGTRMYHDMNTGEWWWSTQEVLDRDTRPGATVIPIILSTDKTQLMDFRNKSAYPLYMTIGNIPKEIRRKPSFRAYVLLAYLPTSRLTHIPSLASRRRCLSNLYHACLGNILSPLKVAGTKGTPMESGDGLVRRGHPLFACFIGDYPEQVLVTCTTTGDCVQCPTFRDNLQDFTPVPGLRHLASVLEALEEFDVNPGTYYELCEARRLKPVIEPFWKDLPYAHVYRSITPDILHQLYQGVMKHLIAWITDIYGAAEIDARCRRLPPNHNIHLFLKGISSLSRVTGQEHSQICQFILALILDIPIANQPRPTSHMLVRAVRAMLDFLYLAQYPIHTTDTIDAMNNALTRFHDNKDVFIQLGIRTNFNLPKLHFALHYARSIKLFGTTDNFNTEYTERLHIDLAKDAYDATNHKDEFPQMTRWLERKEKMARHAKFIWWKTDVSTGRLPDVKEWLPPGLDLDRSLKMAKSPTVYSVPLDRIQAGASYGAINFMAALARFVVLRNYPTMTSKNDLEREIANIRLPCRNLPVWHRIKYLRTDPVTGVTLTADAIHAQPARRDGRDRPIPARFDTVLINDGMGTEAGVKGRRVARVRVVFSLSEKVAERLFLPGVRVPRHLAYVEWFSPFSNAPDPNHRMYKVTRSLSSDGSPLSSIVPVANIFRSVHLLPKFGPVAPVEWTSSNVMDKCNTFFLNSFTDKHLYRVLY